MVEDDLTPAQLQLLKARASKFVNFRQQNILSAEHGLLSKDIDQCLAFGLLKHGYDEELPTGLSASVFVPFNKCLTLCMQHGVHRNKEFCEICDGISDLTRHSSTCMGHPEACPTCRTFFNLLEYHLLKCYTCDMHLCTKLKLKLLKYQNTANGGLVDLWPKIQQYIARLFPTLDQDKSFTNCANVITLQKNKPDMHRYPSVFDSATPPASPCVVARGLEQEQANIHYNPVDAARHVPSMSHIDEFHRGMDDLSRIVDGAMNMKLPMLPNYQFTTDAAYNPQSPGGADDVCMSTDISSFSSLNLNSVDTKLKLNEGFGCVIMGEPRQLRKLADHWTTLKRRLEGYASGQSQFRTEYDGVILDGTNSGMKAIAGQYRKNQQWRKITYVGSGVAGKCYLAVDMNSEAQFAVKKIDLLKYQAEELELWSELEHPNLVQLYGAMRVKNKVYIFSEFYAAGNMAEFIEGHRMLDQWLSVWFLSQLLDALVYLKRKDILHEDIKADNIFLKPDSFKVGLGDFGLSRKGKCPPGVKPIGGQHQWSPEKAKSEGHGYPADVWAANCTFLHMLSGDPPWKRRFPEICFLHFKIANDSPPLEDIPANLQPVVDSFIKAAYVLSPDDRPTAGDLLQHDCFDILYYADHSDPVFRSHIVEIDEEEDMDFEGYDGKDSMLSIDSLLEGMEDKQTAIDYISQLCSTLEGEEAEGAKHSPVSGAAAASALRKQFSVRVPAMESIIEDEELDVSLGPTDLGLQKNILDRREMPAVPPLVLSKGKPAASQEERRHSFGRSNTSPSPTVSTDESLFDKRDTLRKQETSPAIVLTLSNSQEDGLCGEKDIFDLNPHTSGYATGSYMPDNDPMSLNIHQSEAPLSHLANGSSYGSAMYEPSSLWLGSSDAWNLEAGPTSAVHGSYSGLGGPMSSSAAPLSFTASTGTSYADNRMNLIHLKPDNTSGTMNGPLEEKFDLSSSLKILKDSLSSFSNHIEPRSILTIVNGLTQIDATDVLIRGNETWQDIVEQNIDKINSWHIDGYTYYIDIESGCEVVLTDVVPKEKTNAYILPASERSTWCIRGGRLIYAHSQ